MVYSYAQKSPFFLSFKNGLNAVPWCCLHTMKEYVKNIKGDDGKNGLKIGVKLP